MKRIDLLDLSEESRDLVRECEAKGERTLFQRGDRPVAVLVSWDEYLALRETIEIANDSLFFAHLAQSDSEAEQERFASIDLHFENERLRLAESLGGDWDGLSAAEKEAVAAELRRIDDDPIVGAPLFEPLKGLWSHRTGDLRIVYRIVTEARFILILAIGRVT